MSISFDPCRERPLLGSSMPLHQHGTRYRWIDELVDELEGRDVLATPRR